MDKWQKRFVGILREISTWSSCARPDRQIACVIVRDKRILVSGYNGAPAGCNTCIERGGCYRTENKIPPGVNPHLCYATHAEQNAIAQAAKLGISIDGAELYVTNKPCSMCARLIINSGIKQVSYLNDYPDEFADKLFAEAGLELVKLSNV